MDDRGSNGWGDSTSFRPNGGDRRTRFVRVHPHKDPSTDGGPASEPGIFLRSASSRVQNRTRPVRGVNRGAGIAFRGSRRRICGGGGTGNLLVMQICRIVARPLGPVAGPVGYTSAPFGSEAPRLKLHFMYFPQAGRVPSEAPGGNGSPKSGFVLAFCHNRNGRRYRAVALPQTGCIALIPNPDVEFGVGWEGWRDGGMEGWRDGGNNRPSILPTSTPERSMRSSYQSRRRSTVHSPRSRTWGSTRSCAGGVGHGSSLVDRRPCRSTVRLSASAPPT
mgnify:CR=1 FL=1